MRWFQLKRINRITLTRKKSLILDKQKFSFDRNFQRKHFFDILLTCVTIVSHEKVVFKISLLLLFWPLKCHFLTIKCQFFQQKSKTKTVLKAFVNISVGKKVSPEKKKQAKKTELT